MFGVLRKFFQDEAIPEIDYVLDEVYEAKALVKGMTVVFDYFNGSTLYGSEQIEVGRVTDIKFSERWGHWSIQIQPDDSDLLQGKWYALENIYQAGFLRFIGQEVA